MLMIEEMETVVAPMTDNEAWAFLAGVGVGAYIVLLPFVC